MSQFRHRVSLVTGVAEEGLERLAGGDLSGALLVRYPDGRQVVAKSGMVAAEAAMLRAIAGAGLKAPTVEGEYEGVLLLGYVENDGIFSPRAWADIGAGLRQLHAQTAETYGWPGDFAIGSVELSNRQSADWTGFWIEQRLLSTAAVLDRPWRERVAQAAEIARRLLPEQPRPALLHGDLWSGNVLVQEGGLAALIDPACYYGDSEVDLAMLTLFDAPPPDFWESYGPLDDGVEERRAVYQLFPALLHIRLHGAAYYSLADRLLTSLGA